MGRTVWCFWLDEREAHRIPCRTYQRIMSGDDALPALATRTVPIVEAILEVDRRTVLALLATNLLATHVRSARLRGPHTR